MKRFHQSKFPIIAFIGLEILTLILFLAHKKNPEKMELVDIEHKFIFVNNDSLLEFKKRNDYDLKKTSIYLLSSLERYAENDYNYNK